MSAPMEIGQQPMMQSQEISKLEKSLSLIILISSKELKLLLRNSIDSEIIDQNYTYYSEEIEIEKIVRVDGSEGIRTDFGVGLRLEIVRQDLRY
jgi:hypothetical protein